MSPSSGRGELMLFRVSHASDHAPVWIELAGGNRRRGEFARPKTCFIPKGAQPDGDDHGGAKSLCKRYRGRGGWREASELASGYQRANSTAGCGGDGASSEGRGQNRGIPRREIRRCIRGRHDERSAGAV